MSSAVVCSGAGRGQGTAFEDFGEEFGGGGEMFLVPGPDALPQVGEADLQLVAVVAYGGVDEGARVGPYGWVLEQSRQRVDGGDPRVEHRPPDTAPGGVVEEVPAQRTLPGKHRSDPATVRTHQHVGVQEIAVDEIAALGAGREQRP